MPVNANAQISAWLWADTLIIFCPILRFPDWESVVMLHESVIVLTWNCVCVCVQGVDSMAHYEQALRQVRYRNWRPATLTERRFRLTCSELNGRYTSNEFILEVIFTFSC